MKKTISILSIVALVFIAYSCRKTPNNVSGTAYLDLPATTYEYSTAGKTSDPKANDKATLGRVLFYDTHLSINNAISCGSCHKQALGFSDNVALSVGYEGKLTKRNSKSIANIGGDNLENFKIDTARFPLFWDGREDVLQNLIARPVTNHVEMGIDDFSVLPAKLSGLSYYPQLFSNAYSDNAVTTDRISECVADFLVSIQSHNTRFDDFMNSAQGSGGPVITNPGMFSPTEFEGYNLFTTKYNCEGCHHIMSNSYSTFDFFDIGLDKNYTDMGRGTITRAAADNGKFKVPGLRNVALSAPYMHDGRYKTLGEVIDHYSQGIASSANLDWNLRNPMNGQAMAMNISDHDKEALVAFLGTLTDYKMITDPKFSNPFKTK